MAAGAAGVPGQSAEQVRRRGGDSATTPHPRMEVLRAQERACRHGPAECLRMQPGKEAKDAATCPGCCAGLTPALSECQPTKTIFFRNP